MDNLGTVKIVVSGKSYPDVPKSVLIKNSDYFKALFSGNYNDSSQMSCCFPNFSSTAFEFLLHFMSTGDIVFKGKNVVNTVEKILAISDFFCMDSIRGALRHELLSLSVHRDRPSDALPLAGLLNIEKEYVEACFKKFGSPQMTTRRYAYCSIENQLFDYEFLTAVVSTDKFWTLGRYTYCFEFFFDLKERIQEILKLVLLNPPHLKKMRTLLKNLNLDCIPWNNLKLLLSDLPCENLSTKKCMVVAIKEHFGDLRQEVLNKISCIRVCYTRSKKKTNDIGILEFDLDSWSWVLQKTVNVPFQVTHCVMSRDYTNVFVDTGLIVLRRKCYSTKHVVNPYIGELSKWLNPSETSLATCVLGKMIFMFFQCAEYGQTFLSTCMWYSKPTLFKFDVFSHEFTECTSLPITCVKMVAQRNKLYVAGFSSEATRHLMVFCYDVTSNEVKEVVSYYQISGVGFPGLVLAMRANLLYVFFDRRLDCLIIDTEQGVEQPVKMVTLQNFCTKGWNLSIVQICKVSDGFVMLLNVEHNFYNCDFLGLMLAHLNTGNGIFKSLGFLPNPGQHRWVLLVSPLEVQMEQRNQKKKLDQSELYPDGINELQNRPEKHSSMYY